MPMPCHVIISNYSKHCFKPFEITNRTFKSDLIDFDFVVNSLRGLSRQCGRGRFRSIDPGTIRENGPYILTQWLLHPAPL